MSGRFSDEAFPSLVIATILRKEGTTGVHTHVRQLRQYLDECGTPSTLVTPFSRRRPLTLPVFGVRLVLERCSRAASCFHRAELGFCGLARMAGVYVRVGGMGAPIKSNARRWLGVGGGEFVDGLPADADGVAGEGGQVVEQVAAAAVGASGLVVLVGGFGLGAG